MLKSSPHYILMQGKPTDNADPSTTSTKRAKGPHNLAYYISSSFSDFEGSSECVWVIINLGESAAFLLKIFSAVLSMESTPTVITACMLS
jgi:hypothetical protein